MVSFESDTAIDNASPSTSQPCNDSVLSVAELDHRLKLAVENTTMHLWVRGEISGLKLAASGHTYFALKDEKHDALIDAVAYRANAQRLRAILRDGERVLVRGRATIWAPKGKLQFVVETAKTAGRGALLEALEALKRKLQQEGLFDQQRKKTVPTDAHYIGVVTSSSGAVIHDIVRVAFRRGGVSILLSPAIVQGDEAPQSIVQALDKLQRVQGLDVIIVGRGGGSFEDLMAFNDERVVRKIAQCPIAVVSAVGHEVDITLTDLVADARASTPSQAAELVVADQQANAHIVNQLSLRLSRAVRVLLKDAHISVQDLLRSLARSEEIIAQREQRLDELLARAQKAIEYQINTHYEKVAGAHRHLLAVHPQKILADAREKLLSMQYRAKLALFDRLQSSHHRLSAYQHRIEALSPKAVLARGYAIALGPDHTALVDASQVSPGQAVHIILHSGAIDSQVVRCRPS